MYVHIFGNLGGFSASLHLYLCTGKLKPISPTVLIFIPLIDFTISVWNIKLNLKFTASYN